MVSTVIFNSLRLGDNGPEVADLQSKLQSLGYDTGADESGVFGSSTDVCVREFQVKSFLRVDGVCGPVTWQAIVDAGWKLGDRSLFLSHPVLRGDDVADLQQRLSALGFDCGRIDGLFGAQTARALANFQRNVGMVVDQVCGAETITNLINIGRQGGWNEPISLVKEREQLRSNTGSLKHLRVAIGEPGGLEIIAEQAAKSLRGAGCMVVLARSADQAQLARLANMASVDVYIGLDCRSEIPGITSSYFASRRYSSPTGSKLARAIHDELLARLELPDHGVHGMSILELQATRMTAAHIDICPPSILAQGAPAIVESIKTALEAWVQPTAR